jgi:hypothetical protein
MTRNSILRALQAAAHQELSDAREQLAASAHLTTRWQPVAVAAADLHFAKRYVRFNPQTQFLFASRRSRTPRGALFYPTQVQTRHHSRWC